MSDILSQKLSYLYTSKKLPWIIIGVAIALRLIRYLHNPSLWFDESVIGTDIINRSYLDFINPSPDWSSKHPFGFLVLVKFAVETFGNSEYALRLVPLIFGSISVVLFYKVARHYVKYETLLIALSLFAFVNPLIYQASNVKPYSGDLAFALIIFQAAIYMQSVELSIKRIMITGLLGAIILWISHPSAFVLAGAGMGLTLFYVKRKQWHVVGKLLIVFIIWAASFIAVYLNFTSKLIDNIGFSTDLMMQYENAYIPFPPRSLADIKWIADSFLNVFDFPVGLPFTGLAAVAFVLGCFSMYRRNPNDFFMLISPVVVTLLAAVLRRYPFNGRVIVFLVPFFLLFIAEGVEYMRKKISIRSVAPGLILVGFLLAGPISWAAYHVKVPDSREEIRPVIQYIKDNWQAGDIVYVHYYPQYAFEYYTKVHPDRIAFAKDEYIVGIAPRGWYRTWRKQGVSKYYDPGDTALQTDTEILNKYIGDLNKLKGRERAWILFSAPIFKDGMQEEKFFRYHLDKIGNRLDAFGRPGIASVYLYDLSDG